MRDFLSDMLTRIRNGQRAGLNVIYLNSYMPRICFDILEILQDEGYIRGFSEYSDSKTDEKKIESFFKIWEWGEPCNNRNFSCFNTRT